MVHKVLRMRKWGDRVKKVEQLAQSFQLNPLASPYKPRLWPCQPSSIWKLFPRQIMAFSFAQSCKEVTQDLALDYVISLYLRFYILCVWRITCWYLCFAFPRLYMFLRLRKKRPPWGKGCTWLPVTVSCGITTGKYKFYIAKCGESSFVRWWLFVFQDLHTVLDALLWGDTRGRCL